MYPTVEKWDVCKAAYAQVAFGARGRWIIRADFGDCTEEESAAIGRGRSFKTRKAAREWIETHEATHRDA
jgi:hypothetical protein